MKIRLSFIQLYFNLMMSCVLRKNAGNSEKYHVISDAGGNVTQILKSDADDSLTVVNNYEYGPFGKILSFTEGVENSYEFNTKYTDEETGLVYYGFRFYDSQNGRWLNQDPIGVNGGINVYNSVSNNMVNGFAGEENIDIVNPFVVKLMLDPFGLKVYFKITPTIARNAKVFIEGQIGSGRGLTSLGVKRKGRKGIFYNSPSLNTEIKDTHLIKGKVKKRGENCFELEIKIRVRIAIFLFTDGFYTSTQLAEHLGHEQRHVRHFINFFKKVKKKIKKIDITYKSKKKAKKAWDKFFDKHKESYSFFVKLESNHRHKDFLENGVPPLPGTPKLPKGRPLPKTSK